MSLFGSLPLTVIEKSLNASSLRQKVLSNNIANVDTPGFKRSDVSFDSMLQNFLESDQSAVKWSSSDPRYMPVGTTQDISQINPQVVTENSTSVTNNGNNEDIDSDMSQLAENQLRYETLIEGLNTQFSELNSAINGGK